MSTEQSSAIPPWVPKLIGALVAVAGLAWIFRDFLWKVIQALMLNVVPILFTPVILELSVCAFGLFIVLLFCYFRSKKHDDEWVYISQVEPEAEMESIPEQLRKRVGDTVMTSKPLQVEVDELPLESIEGLIELGLFDEAEAELAKGSAADRRRTGFVRLQLLLHLKAERWEAANEYVASRPASPEWLAETTVEAARFFVKQKPSRKAEAGRCLELGKLLSVGTVVNAIDGEPKLQKLA